MVKKQKCKLTTIFDHTTMMNLSHLTGLRVKALTEYSNNRDSLYLCIKQVMEFAHSEQGMYVDEKGSIRDILGKNLHHCTVDNQILLLQHYMRCRSREPWLREYHDQFAILYQQLVDAPTQPTSENNIFLQILSKQIMNDLIWPDLCFIPYIFGVLVSEGAIRASFFVLLIDTDHDIIGTFEVGSHDYSTDNMIILCVDRENLTFNLCSLDQRLIYVLRGEAWIKDLRESEITVDQIENCTRIASSLSVDQMHARELTDDLSKLNIFSACDADVAHIFNTSSAMEKKYVINPITKRKIQVNGDAWKKLGKTHGSAWMQMHMRDNISI